MSQFTGAGQLMIISARRDRIRMMIWLVAILAITAITVPALEEMFPTEAERISRAAFMQSPAAIIFGGPGYGATAGGLGPMVVSELAATLQLVAALLGLLTVIRHTRTEEESGRDEIIRANPVGRLAPLTAAVALCIAINAALIVTMSITLAAFGLGIVDSIAFAVSLGFLGVVFGGIGLVCAQLSAHARSAVGIGMALLSGFFLLRIAGNLSDTPAISLDWFSPFGWAFELRPWAGLTWWPLLLFTATACALIGIGSLLSIRRDYTSGLIAAKAGRPVASVWLRGPLSLFVRLIRGTTIPWFIGLTLTGLLLGSFVSDIEPLIEQNPELAPVFGGATDAIAAEFVATIISYLAMAAAALGILTVARLKTEVQDGRAEVLLATSVGRIQLIATSTGVGVLTAAVGLILGGVAFAFVVALEFSDSTWVGDTILATIGQLPVPAFFAALAGAAIGLNLRLLSLVWGWLVVSITITMFGPLLDLPSWAMRLSAFEQIDRIPLGAVDAAATSIVLLGIVVAFSIGLFGFRRRDISA